MSEENIDKAQKNRYRLYKERVENACSIMYKHSKVTRKSYKYRIDNWECLGFAYKDKWYMHKPEADFENKMRWDLYIKTDHTFQINESDLIFVEKKKKIRIDYKRIMGPHPRDKKTSIVPIIISALRSVSKMRKRWLEKL